MSARNGGDTKSTPNGTLVWTKFPDGHYGWTKIIQEDDNKPLKGQKF
jgi:hypothetical protein